MKKQLKRKCIVYGLGIIVYAGAVWGAARFMLSDQEKFAIFLGTYLLIGYGAFQKLSEEIMEMCIRDRIWAVPSRIMAA